MSEKIYSEDIQDAFVEYPERRSVPLTLVCHAGRPILGILTRILFSEFRPAKIVFSRIINSAVVGACFSFPSPLQEEMRENMDI